MKHRTAPPAGSTPTPRYAGRHRSLELVRSARTQCSRHPRRVLSVLVSAAVAIAGLSAGVTVGSSPAHAASASSVTWPSGVFLGTGANTKSVQAFNSYRGSAVTVAEVYASRRSWSDFATNLWGVKQYTGFGGRLSIGVPLTIGNTSLSSIASGAADRYFAAYAKNLAATGRGNSDLRLGWEFNGNWYPWSAYTPATYIAAFRHVASLFKKALPKATIDWNGNWGGSQCKHNPFTELYPGNAYVDVVGLDAYDGGWVAANSGPKFANWQKYSFSLQDWYNFALAHGKKFAMAEWGLVADGEKDNPAFIQGMYNFFRANAAHIAYEAYFNSSGSSLYDPNKYPKSSAEYHNLWSSTASATTNTRTAMSASAQDGPWGTAHTVQATGLPTSATGTVTFTTIGAAHRVLTICRARVANGRAGCSGGASYTPGSHPVAASYGGDTHNAAHTANTTLLVSKRTPRLSSSAAHASITQGQRETLLARDLPGSGNGTTLTFTARGTTLCTGRVSGGRASCRTAATLARGVYAVTARWPGTTYFQPISATTSFTVR